MQSRLAGRAAGAAIAAIGHGKHARTILRQQSETAGTAGEPVRIALEIEEDRLVILPRRQPPAHELRAIGCRDLDPLGAGKAVIARRLPFRGGMVEEAALESRHVARRAEIGTDRYPDEQSEGAPPERGSCGSGGQELLGHGRRHGKLPGAIKPRRRLLMDS